MKTAASAPATTKSRPWRRHGTDRATRTSRQARWPRAKQCADQRRWHRRRVTLLNALFGIGLYLPPAASSPFRRGGLSFTHAPSALTDPDQGRWCGGTRLVVARSPPRAGLVNDRPATDRHGCGQLQGAGSTCMATSSCPWTARNSPSAPHTQHRTARALRPGHRRHGDDALGHTSSLAAGRRGARMSSSESEYRAKAHAAARRFCSRDQRSRHRRRCALQRPCIYARDPSLAIIPVPQARKGAISSSWARGHQAGSQRATRRRTLAVLTTARRPCSSIGRLEGARIARLLAATGTMIFWFTGAARTTLSTGGTERKVDRRLAAILAPDIAGYSTLMGADEEATVRDLKAHQAIVLP